MLFDDTLSEIDRDFQFKLSLRRCTVASHSPRRSPNASRHVIIWMMNVPIISTKLHLPTPPHSLVPRARLTARLETGTRGKLILLSAPAGFGKTTLIAEWADQYGQGRLVSWVHLDESDNEPVRFLSYIVAALQAHEADMGEVALAGLQSMPPSPVEAALTALVNELDSLDSAVILILDDYHLIDNPSIHSALGFLIEHMPTHMCLVIATRTDPPMAIHRLRAHGQMTEIRAQDLRFSPEETHGFLRETINYQLSASDIAALDRRIEGWIAGLQMVVLSLRGRKDVRAFIDSFSASHRFIMDYLTEEIFNQQPLHTQSFLLRTSILDRLSGPLCDAVLGSAPLEAGDAEPAQVILGQLERANLFLLPMDEERHWYRYHHLFADLLRQRLRHTWPDEIPVLQKRASAWCAANRFIDEAFKYALAGSDLETAAQLVEEHALDLLKRGTLNTLLGWLEKLPDEIILGRPWLSVFLAWTLLLTAQIENIERYLAAAEENSSAIENPVDLRGHIAAIRAYASALRGEVEQAFVLATEALDLLPSDDLNVRSVVTFVLGGVNLIRKDIPAAIEAMKEASEAGERAGNIHVAVSALSAMGDLLLSQGKMSDAEQTYSQALKLGTGRSGRPLPIAASVYRGLAELHLARNDLKSARQLAETGVELAGQWGNVDSLVGGHLVLAQLSLREGTAAEAQRALSEAQHLAATHNLSPGTAGRIAACEALFRGATADKDSHGFLIEPLTERELEVLKLMAEGHSNPDIAGELIIALGTVKAHTSSIYRKLDSRSRTQAVIRARELGIL